MSKEAKKSKPIELKISQEWVYFLFFAFGLALLYIYLVHRTDNIVRDIEKTKRSLIELRAENVTLKSELMQNRSRQNLETRLRARGVKEPNKAVKQIEVSND